MIKKISGLVAALTIAVSMTSNVVAQEASRDYKTALEECFWGLILTKEDQRGLSLGLNVVSGALGLYAYTSATASADTFCAQKEAATALFINESYPALVEDAARGHGTYLTAVLSLAGCEVADHAKVTPLIRNDIATALGVDGYSSQEHLEKVQTLFESVNLHSAAICTV